MQSAEFRLAIPANEKNSTFYSRYVTPAKFDLALYRCCVSKCRFSQVPSTLLCWPDSPAGVRSSTVISVLQRCVVSLLNPCVRGEDDLGFTVMMIREAIKAGVGPHHLVTRSEYLSVRSLRVSSHELPMKGYMITEGTDNSHTPLIMTTLCYLFSLRISCSSINPLSQGCWSRFGCLVVGAMSCRCVPKYRTHELHSACTSRQQALFELKLTLHSYLLGYRQAGHPAWRVASRGHCAGSPYHQPRMIGRCRSPASSFHKQTSGKRPCFSFVTI